MGEGKDGGERHGPSSPPPESSPTVGGGTNFSLNWGLSELTAQWFNFQRLRPAFAEAATRRQV